MLSRPLRRHLGQALQAFAPSLSGVAALEFALVLPFLIILLAGGFEIARYVKSIRQITYASTAIGGMIAQNTSGSVGDEDLQFFRDSAMITYPDVLVNSYAAGKTWLNDIQITMSSITFTSKPAKCTSNCTYTATVAWSGGANPRPCSVKQTAVADSSPPTTTTLPTDTFGPGSLIVVDIVYTYRPVVAAWLFGTIPIVRSFYLQPRYVQSVKYNQAGGGMATACP